MATGDLALGQEQGALSAHQRVVNDFSINRSNGERVRLAIRQ